MNVVGMDRLITGTTEYQIIHNLSKNKKNILYFCSRHENGQAKYSGAAQFEAAP